jgi:hypothetical protein
VLGHRGKPTMAQTVRAWPEYFPRNIPLPHPSPRNQPWFKRHGWFDQELRPVLCARVAAILAR